MLILYKVLEVLYLNDDDVVIWYNDNDMMNDDVLIWIMWILFDMMLSSAISDIKTILAVI